MPKIYAQYCDSLRRLNPDFKYKLWTEKNIHQLSIVNSFLYENTTNYGLKSDLLRYEILLNEGGWYFDCDFEAVRSLNVLRTDQYDLILSPIPEPHPVLANGFMACRPSHPLMESLVKHLKTLNSVDINLEDPNSVINLVGATLLKKMFFRLANKLSVNNTLVLPTNFMYALPGYMRLADDLTKSNFISRESIAIHHWGCSGLQCQAHHRILSKINLFSS